LAERSWTDKSSKPTEKAESAFVFCTGAVKIHLSDPVFTLLFYPKVDRRTTNVTLTNLETGGIGLQAFGCVQKPVGLFHPILSLSGGLASTLEGL
jgi:hypothetical protein